MFLLRVQLGLVDFDQGIPLSFHVSQPLLPNYYQPRQNWVDNEWNTQNLSQPNLGERADGTPCIVVTFKFYKIGYPTTGSPISLKYNLKPGICLNTSYHGQGITSFTYAACW